MENLIVVTYRLFITPKAAHNTKTHIHKDTVLVHVKPKNVRRETIITIINYKQLLHARM